MCPPTTSRTHDDDAMKSHPCDHCDKSFGSASNLLRHVRFMHFEKGDRRLFSCHVCGKQFKHSTSLYAHAKTHEGKREFVCEFCKKSFRTRQHLDVHLVCEKWEVAMEV